MSGMTKMDAVVSDIISSLPCRKELQIDSPKVAIVKRNIGAVLEACSKEENKARYTHHFASTIPALNPREHHCNNLIQK
jgi:hypothetical protein